VAMVKKMGYIIAVYYCNIHQETLCAKDSKIEHRMASVTRLVDTS